MNDDCVMCLERIIRRNTILVEDNKKYNVSVSAANTPSPFHAVFEDLKGVEDCLAYVRLWHRFENSGNTTSKS